jgi:hypothetical protein
VAGPTSPGSRAVHPSGPPPTRGEADPSITLRVYAHVISDQLTEAAAIFARATADWPPATGVVPDIAVPETEAYDLAYARALQHVLALADVPPPIMDEARDALAELSQ